MSLHAYSSGRLNATSNMPAGPTFAVMEGASRRSFFGRRGNTKFLVTCDKSEGVMRRLPSGLSGRSGTQLKIPTPHDLERLRTFRQQQQQRQQQQRQQLLHRQEHSSEGRRSRSNSRQRAPGAAAEEHEEGLLDRKTYQQMADKLRLKPEWRPQASLLHQVGLSGPDLAKLAVARPGVFLKQPSTIRRKLKFLREVVGLSEEELVKVLTKFPRILEYQMDRTVRPRLDFLKRCGVPEEEVCKVVVKAPMVLELSVGETLERRAAFLTKQLGLREGELGKLVARHPQILTCTEEMMAERVAFLRERGLEQQQIGKAVLAHPQVLHYKIESMRERTEYLISVGMTPKQVAAAVCRFPQLFSLNVESNIAPKWRYLVEHLGGDVNTLCGYPGYLSLSLANRIIPRHRYFQRCKPDSTFFAIGNLKCADKRFATEICGGNLQEYEEFKAQLEAEQAQHEQQQQEEEEEEAQQAAAGPLASDAALQQLQEAQQAQQGPLAGPLQRVRVQLTQIASPPQSMRQQAQQQQQQRGQMALQPPQQRLPRQLPSLAPFLRKVPRDTAASALDAQLPAAGVQHQSVQPQNEQLQNGQPHQNGLHQAHRALQPLSGSTARTNGLAGRWQQPPAVELGGSSSSSNSSSSISGDEGALQGGLPIHDVLAPARLQPGRQADDSTWLDNGNSSGNGNGGGSGGLAMGVEPPVISNNRLPIPHTSGLRGRGLMGGARLVPRAAGTAGGPGQGRPSVVAAAAAVAGEGAPPPAPL